MDELKKTGMLGQPKKAKKRPAGEEPPMFEDPPEYPFGRGRQTIWVCFNKHGKVEAATRYGGADVENLLPYLGDMVSDEEEEEYWEIVGQQEAANGVAESRIESAANNLVDRLIG